MTKVSDPYASRSEAFEAHDDIPTNPNLDNTIGDVIDRRYNRRDILRGTLGTVAIGSLPGTAALTVLSDRADAAEFRYDFDELAAGNDERHHVANGYEANILLRWGDPVFADAPAFDPSNQSAAAQLRQFGYNNDYVGLVPLNAQETRALLCVNHEYTNEEVMFPGLGRQDRKGFADMTKEIAEIEMAAHGGTIIEIERESGGWAPVLDSRYNRRVTALETEMSADGPAAGHARLQTAADPSGKRIIGMLNNCAGGITPWGTYLTAEENFHGYFWTDRIDAESKRPVKGLGGDQAASYKRYGVPGRWYNWGRYDDRFNIDREPNEVNRFGYIVEIDPADAESVPVKHTALGRFRHEGAESILAADGRVVVYSGDDARFDYLYKFVSAGTYREGDKAHNMTLLSEGTLHVARFDDDGSLHWLPLIHGQGPLTAGNGFASQADVLIDARLAADKLGATPMDRPEDVQPGTGGRVYVMLTNNTKRKEGQEDGANPRADNKFGHIIEVFEAGADHTATTGRWSILVKCGDPKIAEVGAMWHPQTTDNGWFAAPDNCAIDALGRLWVATDQGGGWGRTGRGDGLFALETDGPLRGTSRLFFRCPVGAELCGPIFTKDLTSLFVAVQHPGTDGVKNYEPFGRNSTFEDPATRWPDFQDGIPPRPSVVVITRVGGGRIGT